MRRGLSKLILSGLGTGWLPLAPGTWGAAAAMLIAWLLGNYFAFLPANLILLCCVIFFTIWGAAAAHQLEDEWGEDPSQIVLDEFVGAWISVLFLPFHWPILLTGFLMFRFFDIRKPLGIRKLEKIKKGWGVMLDDILAGIYANLLVQILFYSTSLLSYN